MTTLQSKITLGEEYFDERTGIAGYATALYFNENGCIEVCLENVKEGEVKRHFFGEQRLAPVNAVAFDKLTYETDIEFGKEYMDTQTKVKGWPAVLEFHEHIANRVQLRMAGNDRDGNPKLVYLSIDDFLLTAVESGEKAERKDEKPSPVAREVERR